jgi:hypothetical protein
VEQSLVDHVKQGDRLDLAAGDEEIDEAAMRSWGDSRTCQASVIRDILRGRLAADPDPHGLQLRGARITGRIDLESLATNVNFELTDCLLEEGLLARDAHLAVVVLNGCLLEHPAEPPLDAERLTCSVLSLNKAAIIGHAKSGAVNLVGAHVGGQLDCTRASLHNDRGPALNASSLQVDQDMLLRWFTATGVDKNGAVSLAGAHVGGFLICSGANLHNDRGPALNASSLQVDHSLLLISFTATGAGGGVAVSLASARVGESLDLRMAQMKHATDPQHRLSVEGLTYTGVPMGISARYWRRLLREGTRRYAAQPYQQLAAGYRAQGDERQAREILMAQRDDQLARTYPRPRWPERWWGRITKVTLGYGYQPWRALLFLAAVVALSCVLAVVLGSHGALAQTSNTAAPGRPCTVIQQASVGLDLNLPIGKSVARDRCDLVKDSASVTAAWLVAAGWVLQLLAWAFAALFIAGFTSAVRKT